VSGISGKGEIDSINQVTTAKEAPHVCVKLKLDGFIRTDHWRDLGGGLGFVLAVAGD